MKVVIECWHRGKIISTDQVDLPHGMKDLNRFWGNGFSNETKCDLRRYGKAESRMDSGRTFKYRIEK